MYKKPLKIKKVIFNDPATIVFWEDDTKTVVKCMEGDDFNPEVGIAMAVSKKALGENYNDIRKWVNKYYETHIIKDFNDPSTFVKIAKKIAEGIEAGITRK